MRSVVQQRPRREIHYRSTAHAIVEAALEEILAIVHNF
jgi:hypothetical protein